MPTSHGSFSKATWNTTGFKEYHRQMQLFILLYIEAGSYINDEEDPWEFVVLCAPTGRSLSNSRLTAFE
jgi:hypothetical protein